MTSCRVGTKPCSVVEYGEVKLWGEEWGQGKGRGRGGEGKGNGMGERKERGGIKLGKRRRRDQCNGKEVGGG